MRVLRIAAWSCLTLIVIAAAVAPWLAPAGYAWQDREAFAAPPSHQHWLGTDDLGRDRFARLLYGTRISLLLAPAASMLSTLLAVAIGGLAGYCGGVVEKIAMAVSDLFLSLPWLFLLIAVRAMLPLNASPMLSVAMTFGVLGLLGWTSAARVLCVSTKTLRDSDFLRQARAAGISSSRMFWVHVVPKLRPILAAQFWISIPVFILSEANLGILGLGVPEPMPSWGTLLREMEGLVSFRDEPWKFVPLLLLVAVVTAFQLILTDREQVVA
jgi:peptide/nickel transport system permease protein